MDRVREGGSVHFFAESRAMVFLVTFPAVLGLLLLGAHILHGGGSVYMVIGCVGLCGLLFSRNRWLLYIVQTVLALATIEWLFTTYDIVRERQEQGHEWQRAAIILIGVAGLNVASAALLRLRKGV